MCAVRGIRGATTAEENTKEAVLQATEELIRELTQANQVNSEDVAAVIFTTTPDLNADFPARAARHLGWNDVALLGASEIAVPNGLARCIRILLLVNTEKHQKELRHIYLKEARTLRAQGAGDIPTT